MYAESRSAALERERREQAAEERMAAALALAGSLILGLLMGLWLIS